MWLSGRRVLQKNERRARRPWAWLRSGKETSLEEVNEADTRQGPDYAGVWGLL